MATFNRCQRAGLSKWSLTSKLASGCGSQFIFRGEGAGLPIFASSCTWSASEVTFVLYCLPRSCSWAHTSVCSGDEL